MATADLRQARGRARRALSGALPPQPTLPDARDAVHLLDAWLAFADLGASDLDALARALERDGGKDEAP